MMDVFSITPEEAWPAARALARWFRQRKYVVSVEEALSAEAPLRTTLVARAGAGVLAIDVHVNLAYGDSLRDFAMWFGAQGMFGEIWLAAPEAAVASGELMRLLRRDGVGLAFVAHDGEPHIALVGGNPALTVRPDPGLSFGPRRHEMEGLIRRFNGGERKDALRDVYEAVERATDMLIRGAARRGLLQKTEADVAALPWASQIDVLAAPTQYVMPEACLVSADLRADLHSFRGARNAIDHKVRSRREADARERQFPERMLMGCRLMAALQTLMRKRP